ncbi:hypothetical protein [Pseudomonas laurylsulfatiphila]|uniref:hypothetical protein n=1 Tax=Pseudomonas laurylsulfatiphila TaxID=2011015 RepID=UPI003D19D30D
MKQYSFYNVDLLLDGIPVTGFTDNNSIISAGRTNVQHTKVIGARGEMSVATIADRSGRIVFTILQTSDYNAVLNSRAILSQNTGLSGNRQTFDPIQGLMNDKMGLALVTGVNGFIPVMPAIVRGTGIVSLSWTVEFEQIWFTNGQYESVGN